MVCVDPSARMLEQIPDDPRLVAVQASAEDLVIGSRLLPVFPAERYLAIVRDRYMSLLSTFDDEEIAAGIEEIRRYPGERVEFDDHFAFVLGISP